MKNFKVTLFVVIVLIGWVFLYDAFAVESPKVICIDPGHQRKGNYEMEPIGPGAKEMKYKVSSGTKGIITQKPEYVLVLEVSLKLKEKLEERGYQVVMVREKHDVNISNKERAEIANKAKADLFLRIHADGSKDMETSGMSALYPSSRNPYVANLSKESKKISKLLMAEMALFTKAKNRGVFARDDLSGINWSKVPVSVVEMGFMTNPKEDKLLSDEKYQDKLVKGMVNAIELYFQ